jgi:hypothetical protein
MRWRTLICQAGEIPSGRVGSLYSKYRRRSRGPGVDVSSSEADTRQRWRAAADARRALPDINGHGDVR